MPINVQHGAGLLAGYGRVMRGNARVNNQAQALDAFGNIITQGIQQQQQMERQTRLAELQNTLNLGRDQQRLQTAQGYTAENNRLTYLRKDNELLNSQLDELRRQSSHFDQSGQDEYSNTVSNLSSLDRDFALRKIPEDAYLESRAAVIRPLVASNPAKNLKNQPGDIITEGVRRYQVTKGGEKKFLDLDPNAPPEALQAHYQKMFGKTAEGIPFFVDPTGKPTFLKQPTGQTNQPKPMDRLRVEATVTKRLQNIYNNGGKPFTQNDVERGIDSEMLKLYGTPIPEESVPQQPEGNPVSMEEALQWASEIKKIYQASPSSVSPEQLQTASNIEQTYQEHLSGAGTQVQQPSVPQFNAPVTQQSQPGRLPPVDTSPQRTFLKANVNPQLVVAPAKQAPSPQVAVAIKMIMPRNPSNEMEATAFIGKLQSMFPNMQEDEFAVLPPDIQQAIVTAVKTENARKLKLNSRPGLRQVGPPQGPSRFMPQGLQPQ